MPVPGSSSQPTCWTNLQHDVFFRGMGPKDGNGSRAAPIRLPQVTDLSLAGCSPAEPASVQAGKANMAPGKTACAAQCRSLQTHAPKKGKLTPETLGGCQVGCLGADRQVMGFRAVLVCDRSVRRERLNIVEAKPGCWKQARGPSPEQKVVQKRAVTRRRSLCE